MNTTRATLIGALAIILWGTLALFADMAGNIPPFQLLTITFGIIFLMMLAKWFIRKEPMLHYFKQPLSAWMLGIAGLFGYHFFYFIAVANAPTVEASLIAYLWPLLIVIFSSLLPGEQRYLRHWMGAAIALFGCLQLLGFSKSDFQSQYLTGYLAAALCAFIWAGYSVATRLVKQVPTDTIGWICGAVSLLAYAMHLMTETTHWPSDHTQWIGIIGLGTGAFGFTFVFWDYGLKHGNIQLLGILAYAAPIISTVLLIFANKATFSTELVIACIAVTSGALIANKNFSISKK